MGASFYRNGCGLPSKPLFLLAAVFVVLSVWSCVVASRSASAYRHYGLIGWVAFGMTRIYFTYGSLFIKYTARGSLVPVMFLG